MGVLLLVVLQEAVGIINDNLSKGPAYACQVLIENAAARSGVKGHHQQQQSIPHSLP